MNDYDNFGTCDLTAMKHGLCNYSERHTCHKEVGVVVVRGMGAGSGEGWGEREGRRGVDVANFRSVVHGMSISSAHLTLPYRYALLRAHAARVHLRSNSAQFKRVSTRSKKSISDDPVCQMFLQIWL